MHQATSATFVDALAAIEQVQEKIQVPDTVATLGQMRAALVDLHEQICSQADGTEDIRIAPRHDYLWALQGTIEFLSIYEGADAVDPAIVIEFRPDLVPERRSMHAALKPVGRLGRSGASRARRTSRCARKRQRAARCRNRGRRR